MLGARSWQDSLPVVDSKGIQRGGTIPRRVVLLALLGVAGAVASSVACEDAYEPPCRVERTDVLVRDPTLAGGLSLAMAHGQAVASWIRTGDSADAGVDAGLVGLPTVDAFEVAVVDGGGTLARRATVPAPPRLRARFGGLAEAGVLVEDAAFLVHWVETSTTTDDRGLLRSSAALEVARVRDGEPARVSVPEASCERCSMLVAGASLGAESIFFVRMDPDARGLPFGAGAQPAFVVLRIREDGTVAREAAPWLGIPARTPDGGLAAASPSLSLDVDASGALLVGSSGLAWRVDAALRVLAGPVLLPSAADVHLAWDVGGEASTLWTVSPYDDGRSTAPTAVRDLFSGRFPAGGQGGVTRARVSSAREALAIDRSGDDVGALFESNGRLFFAEVAPDGTKHGGDLLLGARRTVTADDGTAATGPAVVLARGQHRFVAVSAGSGEIAATEVVCAR